MAMERSSVKELLVTMVMEHSVLVEAELQTVSVSTSGSTISIPEWSSHLLMNAS
jgi:hypothetical protein